MAFKKIYFFEIFDAAGNLVCKSEQYEGYLNTRESLFLYMTGYENESTAFIYRVLRNGKIGEERRFILKNNTVVEFGLLKPKVV